MVESPQSQCVAGNIICTQLHLINKKTLRKAQTDINILPALFFKFGSLEAWRYNMPSRENGYGTQTEKENKLCREGMEIGKFMQVSSVFKSPRFSKCYSRPFTSPVSLAGASLCLLTFLVIAKVLFNTVSGNQVSIILLEAVSRMRLDVWMYPEDRTIPMSQSLNTYSSMRAREHTFTHMSTRVLAHCSL